MRHINKALSLIVFSVIALSSMDALAGMNGGGNGAPPQAVPPANAPPRAGRAENPGSPQAGPRDEGNSIVEEKREEVINADPPPVAGRKRYSFSVPVNVDDVPEGHGLYVLCTLARKYSWEE